MHNRLATTDDLSALLDLYAELQPANSVLDPTVATTAFREILERDGNDVLVLGDGDGDEIIGATYLNIVPNLTRGARPFGVIENVIITAARRGEKLGKRIMADTLERARAAGCYKVMLMTGSSRPETHAFYESCGFDRTAKQAYLIRW